MPELIIDGKQIEVEDGITLIQACEEAGVEIPRFCYHERLSIAGNCRMCLVEVVGMPKPMASCALGVNDLRKGPEGQLPEIKTNSATVKKAREGVMEFLLINHPLDCPICDQGGECDLQDQAMAFGIDANRYDENKRAVENKNIGPLIKTIMTRCIHCTRCVRFMTEVAGIEELGLIGRGEDAEITTYLQQGMTSELSGNVIDLCPVGALTSRPFAFTMAFGIDANRYDENKRAVENKNIGPLIKTIMTRCIHCTRCVRFMTEVAGIEELGLIGRGEDAEITTYLQQGMTSELSGNVIDLCPVGALTSRPFAFTARPWEMRKTETIDVMDAVGSNIRVDVRGAEVMRVMPRNHDAVNEEWISDKSRFIWDGLRTQRLDKPFIRENGRLRAASWDEALDAVGKHFRHTEPEKMAAIAGDLCAVEEMFALQQLMTQVGAKNMDCRADGTALDPRFGRASTMFNTTIEGIEDADVILLVGVNPRNEASVLNARIRRVWRNSDLRVGLIGEAVDLTYDYDYLGAGPETLTDLLDGKNAFADVLKSAANPMLVLGQGALTREDGAAVLKTAARLAHGLGLVKDGWNGFNVLHTAAARMGGLDIGFLPADGGLDRDGILKAAADGGLEFVYLLGVDEIDTRALEKAFVVYQGSHGDRGAHHADVILPGAAYTEKNGTYVNTEGRVQRANRAAFPPGEAREDWAIIRAISGLLDTPLPFDNETQLRAVLFEKHPHLAQVDTIRAGDAGDIAKLADMAPEQMDNAPFRQAFEDFYLTNPIARASRIMAECSALKQEDAQQATGTDG